MIEKLSSPKFCKSCGKPAYSFRIGWINNEGVTYWHPRHDYNYCEECRNKTYKRIEREKKLKQKGEPRR